jgi:N-methylhydantoinase A
MVRIDQRVKYDLGIDVGGTFTDFVLLSEDGTVVVDKQLTTPDDPSVAVLGGVERVCSKAGRPFSDVTRIVHGTTLVANSLIERRGARVALICTAGFRDVIEIGRESRYDLYNLELKIPAALVPRPLRFEVRERIRSDGTVIEPIDLETSRALVARLRQLDVESVGVSFINAYVNPEHEQRLAELFAADAPEIDVSLSSDISPEWREYERTSSVAANAYVRPLVRRYLRRLEVGFKDLGSDEPLYVMLSHGGVTSADVAGDLAIQLVESGPAGGVMAAAFFADRVGLGSLISFDMGGTTTKVSLIEKGVPLLTPELEVARVARFMRGSGLPLKVPTIELVEIGAGGGSLGYVDALGLLKVGPRSAGADPGPACYGRGGTHPTVTDADLFLGYLNPEYFLGGEMPLYPDRAKEALEATADQAGLTIDECARGIMEIVNQQMALTLRTHIVERGRDPRRYSLLAFGGAGPVHAYEIARHLGIRSIICPPIAGVASALGFLVSPFRIDLSKTHPSLIRDLDWETVEERFAPLEERAQDLVFRAGGTRKRIRLKRYVDIRYQGQGYMVTVAIPRRSQRADAESVFRPAFERSYRDRFGSYLSSSEVEVVHWRISAQIETGAETMPFAPPVESREPQKGERLTYFPEARGFVTCPVYDRYALHPGMTLNGPALLEERESTTAIGPSGLARVDEVGNVAISIG